MYASEPRTNRHASVVRERELLLKIEPKVQPLRQWTADLVERRIKSSGDAVVPHFDPGEAGVETRVLFLMEAPGPMTHTRNRRPGSGFISVDNDDQTAANCWNHRNQAGLHEGALHWNIVPWYLGAASRKPNAAELAAGAHETLDLLTLLPDLKVVVACGRYAQKGWRSFVSARAPKQLTVIETWHPSPLALNHAEKRREFHAAVVHAALIGEANTGRRRPA